MNLFGLGSSLFAVEYQIANSNQTQRKDCLEHFLHQTPTKNQKTFRPKKNAPSGSKGAQLKKHIDATLGSGNLREAVRLPPGEDLHEWLAVNTVDFFNQVNILYGTLTEFCTSSSCPTMSAGPKYEYRWADGVNIKKPIEVSAPKYVDYLMSWIETQLDDESTFPQNLGCEFEFPRARWVVFEGKDVRGLFGNSLSTPR